jgi:hypothetical protein
VDDLGPGVTVQDIVFHAEHDHDARGWTTITVYFHRE